jgi:hypothetical protein
MSETYIAQSKAIAARMFGGEMIVMSALDSTIFNLNEQATVIWNAADGVTPLREIVEQRICSEFDVTPEIAYHDAEEFANELATHGILLISDQPISPASSQEMS